MEEILIDDEIREEAKKFRARKIKEVLEKAERGEAERWELNFLYAWAEMFRNYKLKVKVEKLLEKWKK